LENDKVRIEDKEKINEVKRKCEAKKLKYAQMFSDLTEEIVLQNEQNFNVSGPISLVVKDQFVNLDEEIHSTKIPRLGSSKDVNLVSDSGRIRHPDVPSELILFDELVKSIKTSHIATQ
jgi:hypothetical protein